VPSTTSMWNHVRVLAVGVGLSVGCGGGSPAPHTEPSPPSRPTAEPEEGDDSMIARLNEAARENGVVETLHGVEVADPYRSLEEDTPETREWIDAQTERTASLLEEWRRPGSRDRLDELLSIGVIGGPAVGGERVFYTKREGDREQPALYVAEDGTPSDEPLVDPLGFGERAALDWYYPSPDGRYVAFGISESGDERSTLHVIDVASGERLDDRIEHTKWSNVEWLHDETGFYYTRYPREGEPDYDPEAQDTYFPRVFFHELGTDPDDDPLVFSGEEGTDFPGVTVSDDDRWLVINVFKGWSESDVYLFDRGARPRGRIPAPTGEREATTVIEGEEALTVGRVHDGRLYLHTNLDAPRYRIATVRPSRAGDRDAWTDVVPEGDAPIEGWNVVGGRLAIHYLDDVRSRVRLFRLDGRESGEVELPTLGSVDGLDGRPTGRRLVFAFSSYLHPPSLLSYDLRSEELSTVDAVETDTDFDRFELARVRVESADGTEIPVTLVHGAEMERDGERPVLLYGYGGFNVSLLPSFTRNALYWIERGGVYAVANLRGGGELGEEWHQAGNLGDKENVFEDFEAVIRWLSESDITRPGRIAITGGSNGGLLMGAMITRCPDAFRAAASYVGLYDMVRYHEFPPAELWVSEYGSAEDPEQLQWLLAYSPYHQVRRGTEYPAVLIETADHDTRVYWGHSTKFAARLQEANTSEHPILFYMVREVGHGAGTRRTDLVDRYVRHFTFLEHELGLSG